MGGNSLQIGGCRAKNCAKSLIFIRPCPYPQKLWTTLLISPAGADIARENNAVCYVAYKFSIFIKLF